MTAYPASGGRGRYEVAWLRPTIPESRVGAFRSTGSLLQIIVGLLFAGVGAILCFLVVFDERPDKVSVIIGLLMVLGGMSCMWTGLLRITRG